MKIIATTILALALALSFSGAAVAYTPTPEQCAQAGAVFNTATQGCDVAQAGVTAGHRTTFAVGYSTTVTLQPGQSVEGPNGTRVWNENDSPITVTFFPSNYFESGGK